MLWIKITRLSRWGKFSFWFIKKE